MVGRAARMRESSEMVVVPGSNGTLKSTRIRHRAPDTSISLTVFFMVLALFPRLEQCYTDDDSRGDSPFDRLRVNEGGWRYGSGEANLRKFEVYRAVGTMNCQDEFD